MPSKKKNITISLEQELIDKLRVRAESEKMSISKFLKQVIEKLLGGNDTYQRAQEEYLNTKPFLDSGGTPYPSRKNLYD